MKYGVLETRSTTETMKYTSPSTKYNFLAHIWFVL